MSADNPPYPLDDGWIAAIHASEDDFTPLGTALVIDTQRVLTCAHVVHSDRGGMRQPLWVAFPKGDPAAAQRVRVASIVPAENTRVADLAVLILAEAIPASISPAPLRCPKPSDLVGRRWWAFGFANGDPMGNSADGLVGASLGYGWVRLDAESRYHVEPGFSGGGLWSPDYAAVVAVVGEANARGDGHAISLYQADAALPGEKLAKLADWSAEAAGETALAAWGWSLSRDPEAGRHWRPRARGVSIDSERGFRFRGRTAALTKIVEWLDRPVPDRQVLVVTGSPGVGKSAVLGRIVTTADPEVRASMPPDDATMPAPLGSVACAVHAKGKTALEVATEIARAASARLPDDAADIAPALRDVLTERGGLRFNVIIDALDEATTPAQARAMVTKIVLPLVETCSGVGARVVVGSRRRDDGGDLLTFFGNALVVLDLDDRGYFDEADLAAYAVACLQLEGDERPDNPYADDAIAVPLAHRIADLADRNFLITGLVARDHGLHDTYAAQPERLMINATVGSALAAYLERVNPVAGLPADQALTVLAFAEAPGLPMELWQVGIRTITGQDVTAEQLARFARSSAANFLVESSTGGRGAVFRLFHQALNEELLHTRGQIVVRSDDELALSHAFIRHGRQAGWGRAPEYLLRSLAAHTARAGVIDDLLTDEAYLLHADLRRLISIADQAAPTGGQNRTRMLHLTPQAIAADPPTRAALFSMTEAMENLGNGYRSADPAMPYRASWAWVRPRTEWAVLEGHADKVRAVCSFALDGRIQLASASFDTTVRIWDPVTGEQQSILEGHAALVSDVCSFYLDNQVSLAGIGAKGTIRIWNPATGELRTTLHSSGGAVTGLCAFTLDGRVLLASASGDTTVRIWDPAAGRELTILNGHAATVSAVCAFTLDGRVLLASASVDTTVRIWDPAAGRELTVLHGHSEPVLTVCAFTLDGRVLLASASGDTTVRIWDPAAGRELTILTGHADWVRAVCAFTVDGRVLLASGGDDRTVRIWDPAGQTQQETILTGHAGWATAVCAFTVDGRVLLASGGDDRTVRIWDPTGQIQQGNSPSGHAVWVRAVRPYTVDGRLLLASGCDDHVVRTWDPATGEQQGTLRGHTLPVNGLCSFALKGRDVLASAGHDRTVRIWDPADGQERAVLRGHADWVVDVCEFTVEGRAWLASASYDGTVRIWDPANGSQATILSGHRGAVNGICAFTLNGQVLLATAGFDRSVRIWEPARGQPLATLTGHDDAVNGICAFTLDGQALLASAGSDHTVRTWAAGASQPVVVLEGHEQEVNSVCAFSVDGRMLLGSASDDRTVRIWDPSTGTCLLTVPVHHEAFAIGYAAGSSRGYPRASSRSS